MPLPKHLRPRWRYLAVAIEAWPDADLDRGSFQSALRTAGRRFLGDPGCADADLSVIRFRFEEGRGEAVVRVRHGHVPGGRAALACISEVGGDPVGLRVEGVSGTIRACEEKYLGGTPEATHTDVAYRTERLSAVVRGDAVDLRRDDTFTGATDIDLEEQ